MLVYYSYSVWERQNCGRHVASLADATRNLSTMQVQHTNIYGKKLSAQKWSLPAINRKLPPIFLLTKTYPFLSLKKIFIKTGTQVWDLSFLYTISEDAIN